jgi:hypothetical protein
VATERVSQSAPDGRDLRDRFALAQELRDYADAVDKDRQRASGLTDCMRDAADEMERLATYGGIALSFIPAAKVDDFRERCRQLNV